MTNIAMLEAAAHDPMPGLLADLEREFSGPVDAVFAGRIVAGEEADFHWNARIAERKLGAVEALEDEAEACDCWLLLGYLDGHWFVAKALVDAGGDPQSLCEVRRFDSAWDAHEAYG